MKTKIYIASENERKLTTFNENAKISKRKIHAHIYNAYKSEIYKKRIRKEKT
jgi:hypothetical protein